MGFNSAFRGLMFGESNVTWDIGSNATTFLSQKPLTLTYPPAPAYQTETPQRAARCVIVSLIIQLVFVHPDVVSNAI
jgi:hypothetical protein